jgi:hypothetical protein
MCSVYCGVKIMTAPIKHTQPVLTEQELDEMRKEFQAFRGETPMQAALAELGLTPLVAAKKLKEELWATTIKAQVVEVAEAVEDESGKITVQSSKQWSYSDPMIDWTTRQGARRDLIGLWGGKPKQASVGDDGSPLVVKIIKPGDEDEGSRDSDNNSGEVSSTPSAIDCKTED